MKLTQNSDVLAENKVLILYLLNKLSNPINNDALYQLVLSVLDMNYFYFQQFLLDLLETKYIVCFPQDNGNGNIKNVYQITDIGKETLNLVSDILPGIMKLKADTNFKSELNAVTELDAVTSEFTPINENEYTVTCKINENNQCLFEVKTYAGSREEAQKIVNNWKENASSIYPELLRILTN